jgi:hypothetical protein
VGNILGNIGQVMNTPRLQFHSGPPDDGCSECDGGGDVGCEFVVAGGDAAPIFEAAKDSLDEIALFVSVLVEGMEALAGRVVGDDRAGLQFRAASAPIARLGAVPVVRWLDLAVSSTVILMSGT